MQIDLFPLIRDVLNELPSLKTKLAYINKILRNPKKIIMSIIHRFN